MISYVNTRLRRTGERILSDDEGAIVMPDHNRQSGQNGVEMMCIAEPIDQDQE